MIIYIYNYIYFKCNYFDNHSIILLKGGYIIQYIGYRTGFEFRCGGGGFQGFSENLWFLWLFRWNLVATFQMIPMHNILRCDHMWSWYSPVFYMYNNVYKFIRWMNYWITVCIDRWIFTNIWIYNYGYRTAYIIMCTTYCTQLCTHSAQLRVLLIYIYS